MSSRSASTRAPSNRWEAYCILCNILRRCINEKNPVLPADPPWDQIVQLSSRHLVTPALAWATRDVPSVPTDIREFLDAVLTLNRARNREMEKTLLSALRVWNVAAMPSVLLKGAASLAGNLYPEPGVRMLSDIDVLVPVERAEEAAQLLQGYGFELVVTENDYAKHQHLAPLRHSDTGICIEIHRHALRSDCRAVLPTETAWREVRNCSFAGVSTQCLTPSMQFIHALAHAQLQDSHGSFNSFSLRTMLELATLAQRHADEMNWEEIAEKFRAAGHYGVLQNANVFILRQFGMENSPAIAAPRRDPLRSLRHRLESRHEWSGGRIGGYFRYYLRRIRERPSDIFILFNPKRLSGHFYRNFLRRWRSFDWR